MIPIVFIHFGKADYLRIAMRQARYYNPRVILLGDDANADHAPEWYSFKNYWQGAQEFDKVYVHQHAGGPNDRGYRMFHYQRWFAVLEWMRAQDIDRVFVCDSDVMVYTNIEAELDNFIPPPIAGVAMCREQKDYRMAASGHSSYWTQCGLESLCDFMLSTYASGMSKLNEKWNWHIANNKPGGVCDMTLLYLWAIVTGPVTNMLYVRNGATFDDNINVSENWGENEFVMQGGIKQIEWRNNQPYGHSNIIGKSVRFNTLHFQGGAKKLMEWHARQP